MTIRTFFVFIRLMKAKTEEFLNVLLWTAEMLTQPSFRNLTSSYESWAYRNGLLRQVDRLEKEAWLERDLSSDDRLYRLTEQGRLHALGGRDPDREWARSWDGTWRMLLFDIPVKKNTTRTRLRRYLKGHNFGCLQNSVWVTPDPMQSEREILSGGEVNVASLLLLESRPCAGESDQEIVEAAWNFKAINEAYAKCEGVLSQHPGRNVSGIAGARSLERWTRAEHSAWIEAVRLDPMLPAKLLPKNYPGQRVWRARKRILGKTAKQIRDLKL